MLTLGKRRYRKHGIYRRGQKATSLILPEFGVLVDDVLDAEQP